MRQYPELSGRTTRALAWLAVAALLLTVAGAFCACAWAPRGANDYINQSHARVLGLRALQCALVGLPLAFALVAFKLAEHGARARGWSGYELLGAWGFIFSVTVGLLALAFVPHAIGGRGARNWRISHMRDRLRILPCDALADARPGGTLPRNLGEVAARPHALGVRTPAMTQLLGVPPLQHTARPQNARGVAAASDVVYCGCGLQNTPAMRRTAAKIILFFSKHTYGRSGRVVAHANGHTAWIPRRRLPGALALSSVARQDIGMPRCK